MLSEEELQVAEMRETMNVDVIVVVAAVEMDEEMKTK